jgi:hypothetical protein
MVCWLPTNAGANQGLRSISPHPRDSSCSFSRVSSSASCWTVRTALRGPKAYFLPHFFLLLLADMDLTKLAWEWGHAIFGSDLTLRHPPEILAIALMYGACNDRHVTVRGAFLFCSEEVPPAPFSSQFGAACHARFSPPDRAVPGGTAWSPPV